MFSGLIIVGGVFVSGLHKHLEDHGMITDIRLVIGFYQLLGQMDNILDVKFPEPVPTLMSFLELMFLDVRNIVRLDCWDVGGFVGKLVTNIAVMPSVFVMICILIYLGQKRTIGAVIAAGGADESAYGTVLVKLEANLLFGVFLLYPTITSTLFRVPQCLELGDHTFHEEDFSMLCDSNEYYLIYFVSMLLILAFPIGMPMTFLFLMYRKKKQLGGVNTTALGGAKLAGDEVEDEDDTYGYLCKDMKAEYWYYEVITYSRKLLLGGMSVFLGRGTLGQAYFIVVIESFFLIQ